MIDTMIKQSIIEVGVPIDIVAPVDHITFTNAKYSAVTVSGNELSLTVEGLILHRPYPQTDLFVDGTKVSEGILNFRNFTSYNLCIALLKPDWQSRKGTDRFEPEKRLSRVTNHSGKHSEFDIGAGYLLHDSHEFEVRDWLIRAESLTLTPKRLRERQNADGIDS